MTETKSPTQYKINLKYRWNDVDGKYSKFRRHPLSTQLESIPRDAKSLLIYEDVPRDEEWELIGNALSSVEHLEVEAGFDEELNDRLMPLHWPLKSLVVDSSCGDVTQTPHILEGRLQQLVLCFTCGIRFQGPTSNDLSKAHREAVEQGDKDEHHVTDGGVTVTYLPQLADDWMRNEYEDKEIDFESEHYPPNQDLNLTHLEIIENDAVDTMTRFALALPDITHNLRTLKIRATNGCDLTSTNGLFFPEMLRRLSRLETLALTLGEIYNVDIIGDDENTDEKNDDKEESQPKPKDIDSSDNDQSQAQPSSSTTPKTVPGLLPSLYDYLPPNIHALHLRLPISLTENPVWEKWIAAFSTPTYLPHLSRFSLACDLAYDGDGRFGMGRGSADDERLRTAKRQVGRLIEALRTRTRDDREPKVEVEPFVETWTGRSVMLDGVDGRWYRDEEKNDLPEVL